MIVLDTTVLVYAVGADHELRAPCRDLVGAVGEGKVDATTTVEVIQEFAHVRARRRDRADACTIARAFANMLSPLLVVEERDLRVGLDLWAQADRLGAFDAVLAAAALSAGATYLVSADQAFATVDGIRHVMPTEAGVRGLIGTG